MKILVTGGTVFVSKFVADYLSQGNEVYVLNRNSRPQVEGVTLIEADRHELRDKLKNYRFDAVIDVCAYTGRDVTDLLDALPDGVRDYILISSSAVYPETNPQPFTEEQSVGANSIWGKYGTNKIAAERELLARFPSAYILRPPYIYGPMQNVYREPFVFDCALENRPFFIPRDGSMKLQFFHVRDLCRVIEKILEFHPCDHIFNVGNERSIDINEFAALCYEIAGSELTTVNVYDHPNQRDYFCFHDYEYALDITRQKSLISDTIDLESGLRESFVWYVAHKGDVARKNYLSFIDSNFARK